MTTLQKVLFTTAVAVLAGVMMYQARQAARLRDQVQTLQQEQAPLAEQVQQLQHERDDAANRLAAMTGEIAKNNTNDLELLKLRGELARLRAVQTAKPSKPPVSASEAADAAAFEQMGRKMKEADYEFYLEGTLSQMKQRLHLTPEQEGSIREILKRDSWPRFNKHKAELEALLTSDQQATYEQFEQETQQDKEGLKAYQAALDVLINLQSNVGLSQEQQTKAFSALLEYGKQKVMYEGKENPSHDSVVTIEQDLARLTLNALKGVLTDEQMAIYQKHEEQMLKVKQFQFPSEKR